MAGINDLELKHWKQYADVLTDSLWLLGQRDKSGAHNNGYHGNFIPQIPNQLMRRFTKQQDLVLDLFLGSGTTLIEAKRLGRHGIGVELLPEVAQTARRNVDAEVLNEGQVYIDVTVGDSTTTATSNKVLTSMQKIDKKQAQLIILHPPYHDIIQFSDDERDLCNADSVKEFVTRFGDVITNFVALLERNRHLAIVIGDKYSNSEWVPLGFYLMQETMQRSRDLRLKGVLVKNMANNRAKLQQENLWRYRALVGGFYIFKHEYILLFKKIR